MNILPKKRWHVRTKENIARVRRDEAKAAEEEKEQQRRIQLAEQEARTAFLREKSRQRLQDADVDSSLESSQYQGQQNADPVVKCSEATQSPTHGHINFFSDIEEGKKIIGTNKEHEEEKKAEKEKYEKSIGYLTYLGQNSKEATGDIPWYEKMPERLTDSRETKARSDTVSVKHKEFLDPLNDLRRYLSCSGIKKLVQKEKGKQTIVKENAKDKKALSSVACGMAERKQGKELNKRTKKKRKHKHKKNKKNSYNSDSESHSRKKHKRKRKHSVDSESSLDLSHHRDHKRQRQEESGSEEETVDKMPKVNIEQLRAERLSRERKEKERAAELLAKFRGEEKEEKKSEKTENIKQIYNSQFHPHLARQNLETNKKYWIPE